MQFKGYHHIGLAVENVEKSLKFYIEGLGGKVTMTFPMKGTEKIIHMVDLGGNAVIEILPKGIASEEANPRWAHIALATDNAREAYAAALAAGANTRTEPVDKKINDMEVCNAFVFGPDGEIIEFFQVK